MLTSIYHDADDEDEDEEDGYWIEGPFEKDIRSRHRGKYVHFTVIRSLMHPVVSSLQTSVQSAFLFAAMKVFVEAVVHCDQAEVASLVMLLRVRLSSSKHHGTFAQVSWRAIVCLYTYAFICV